MFQHKLIFFLPSVYFDYIDKLEKKNKKLEEKNKKLEEVTYNTRFNSGLSDEINDKTEKDELIALRKEFKNLASINKKLAKNNYNDDGVTLGRCCCIVQ